MRCTPFHERTASLNRMQMWFNWDRYVVPDVYVDMHRELRATRDAVSMGDMSPLSKYEIRGPAAAAFLDHTVTRDVTKLEIGGVLYTPWTDDRGRVVGDGLLFRRESDTFRLTADPQLAWLTDHAKGSDVEIDDITDDYGLLAIQGPRSREVMEALTREAWGDLTFSHARTSRAVGVDLLVSRQGFTGELGYEIWVPAAAGPELWDAVAAAGEPFEIQPVAEYAIDVARVEAGLLIVGADYTGAGPDRPGSVIELSSELVASPFEINMGGLVDLEKDTDFVGRSALRREVESGGARTQLVGLVIDHDAVARLFNQAGRPALLPNRVWWYPLPITANGRAVGRATSVTWAPTVGRVVGFGHLDKEFAVLGREVSVSWMMNDVLGDVSARVVELPFLSRRRAN
jgi:aminomethyltransferase